MKITALLLLLVVALGGTPAGAGQQPQAADTVFINGNVYTVSDSQPRAEAIAVKAGRIVFVGSNQAAKAYQRRGTRVVDLKGRTVLPGLTDSHYHIFGVGQREMTLNLEGLTSLEDFLAKVKARVTQAKPGEWVTGRGWIETFWKPPVFPTRQDLDRVAPNNPVFLVRADGHGAVANSAALKIAGVDRNTPAPDGGEIMKDRQTGEPTGMLIDKAQGLVSRHLPAPTRADHEQALILGARRSVQLGWTSVHNAGSSYADIDVFNKLYGEGKVKLRVYNMVYGPGPASAQLFRQGPIQSAFDGRFTTRSIKVVMDGALGSKGAALLEPYADHHTQGLLMLKEEQLLPMLIEALKLGIQVNSHAIGDRANREILNLYEKAFAAVPPEQRRVREPRWRIEHAQILNPADIARFAKLGVIPSMQPSHAIGDLHFAPSRIGLERLKGAYAWQSLLRTGVMIAGGSDAPVERGEPMIEFYAAVARKDQRGFSGEGWHPEEAATREQALKMFTIWAAYAAFEERERGSIEVGKLADLTVLSADIMQIPAPDILKTRCVMTVIGGEIVHQQN